MSQFLDILASKEGLEKSDVFYNYLKGQAWEKGIPLVGLFELTPRCTLDCRMCYVHLERNQMHRDELTTEQWISLMDEACNAGMLFATLTGGECMLYPGFRQIYEYLQSRGVLVTVLTNGTLLDESMVDWLAERPPERVQISVYGSSPIGYEKVTGSAKAFYKVDKAIDLLKQAKIPLSIAVTVSKQMVPDFEAILRYCESKDTGTCHVNSCPFETREETHREFEDYAPTLDEQVEILRIQKKLFDETLVQAACDEIVFRKEADAKKDTLLPLKGITCSAGRNSFSVNWEGKMLPCSVFDYAGSFPLTEGFLSAWKSLNQKCAEYLNPVECVGCEYFKVCRFCPAGHYMKVGEGRANPDVCAEGKRMVNEKLRFL